MWSWLAVSLSGIGAIAGTAMDISVGPLPFVLLAVVALTQSIVAEYTYWIVAGLAISAVADVLHTVTQTTASFCLFLLAQLCYSKAF